MQVAALVSVMLLALLAVCEVHAAPHILHENHPVNSEASRPSKDVFIETRHALAGGSDKQKKSDKKTTQEPSTTTEPETPQSKDDPAPPEKSMGIIIPCFLNPITCFKFRAVKSGLNLGDQLITALNLRSYPLIVVQNNGEIQPFLCFSRVAL